MFCLLLLPEQMASIVVTDKEKQGWLKSWMAIFITRDGLEELVEEEMKQLFEDATKPGHTLINDIKQSHCENKIGTNVNKFKLQQSPCEVEIAKCFIHAKGYKDKTTIKDIDLNGILSIIKNCTRFHTKIINWQQEQSGVFQKVPLLFSVTSNSSSRL